VGGDSAVSGVACQEQRRRVIAVAIITTGHTVEEGEEEDARENFL
jgi:hypothetical protein